MSLAEFGVLTLIILIVLYFVPTVIAFSTHKRQAGAILALNLLLGWTFLGWVAALIWSLAGEKDEPNIIVTQSTSYDHYPQQLPVMADTKPCPFCAEYIKQDAIKCRYCGEMIQDKAKAFVESDSVYKEALNAFNDGNTDKAKKLLAKGLSVDAGNTFYKSLLAKVEVSEDNLQESNVLYFQAKYFFENNDLKSACQKIDKSVELFPGTTNLGLQKTIHREIERKEQETSLHRSAVTELKNGNLQAADASIFKLLSLNPDNKEYTDLQTSVRAKLFEENLSQAKIAIDSKQYYQADALITSCLSYDQNNAQLLELRSRLQAETQKAANKRKMLIAAAIIGGIILLSAGIYGFTIYNGNKGDWDKAQELNTILSYKNYLSKHPDGPHSSEAKQLIENFVKVDNEAWEQALIENSIGSYEMYLMKGFRLILGGANDNLSNSSQGIDVTSYILDTTKAETFCGMFLQQAKDKLDDLYWQRATSSNNVLDYQSYLQKNPNGKHSAEAKQRASTISAETLSVVEVDKVKDLITGFYAAFNGKNYETVTSYLEPITVNFFESKNVSKGAVVDKLKMTDDTQSQRTVFDWSSLKTRRDPSGDITAEVFMDTYIELTADQESYTNKRLTVIIDKESKIKGIKEQVLSSSTPVAPVNRDTTAMIGQ